MRLFVSTTNLAGNSAILVSADGSTALTEIPVDNSTATAVWEIVNTDPNTKESLLFGVWQQSSGASIETSAKRGSGSVAEAEVPLPPNVGA